MHARDKLVAYADELIDEGNTVLASKFTVQIDSFTTADYVDLRLFSKWSTSVAHLSQMMGPLAKAWEKLVEHSIQNNLNVNAVRLQGIVQSLRDNLVSGRLARIEELVAAETFANLIGQAEHLLETGYFLASGVLCRAVLEERLRILCESKNCRPTKTKPTINDYSQALYANQVISKIALKSVEAMAATGNECAHNTSSASAADVRLLYNNLVQFLQQYES